MLLQPRRYLGAPNRASPSLVVPCVRVFSTGSTRVYRLASDRSRELRWCRDVAVKAETSPSEAAAEADEEADFDLLSTKVADLVAHMDEELKGCSIYLVGMMGSGKVRCIMHIIHADWLFMYGVCASGLSGQS